MGLEPSFARNAPAWPLTLNGRLPAEVPEPPFFLTDGLLEKDAREAIEATWLRDQNPVLKETPVEPLGPAIVKNTSQQRKWAAAIAASLVFHAGVAWFFLEDRDLVLIEGSENAGITMLGNASEDQVSAGEAELDATNVTLIDMVEPKPVETITAEVVPVRETAEAVPVKEAETVEAVIAEAPVIETLQPDSDPVTAAVETQAAPPEKPVEAVTEPPPPVTEMTETEEETTPVVSSLVPEILAVDKIAPVEDQTAVAKPAEVVPADTAEPVQAEPVETAKAVVEEPLETVREAPEPAPKPVVKVEPAKPVKKPVTKKAEAKPAEKKAEKKKGEKKASEKKAAAKAEPAPAKKKAGSGGANQGDARRGAADGEAGGTTAAKGKNGSKATAGNAAVSNYPGKVVQKLRRALPRSSKGMRGEVQVSFRVSANGGVSGVRVARSSGQAALDKVATDTVRRAAPFPPIPADAGRSSWDFTVPLAFMR